MTMNRRERWDPAMVKHLLETLPADHHDIATLNNVSKNMDADGYMTVAYKHGQKMNWGRMYSKHGYQNATTNTRNLCGSQYYKDYDMVNAYGNILRQVLQRECIPCPELDDYCANRDAIFLEITTIYPSLSKSDVKRAFIVALHNRNYKKHITDGVSIVTLDLFTRAVRKAAITLSCHKDYAWYLAKAVEFKKPNRIGTFVSWVCQDNEFLIVQSFFQNVPVGPYMFDGQMAEVELSQEALDSRRKVTFEQTGFDMQFIEKPMILSEEAPLLYTPAQPGDRIILFELDGTLAQGGCGNWRFRPGIERLADLVQAGFKVGVFTCKNRRNVPVEKLQIKAGVTFTCVLAREECYKPSESYLKQHATLDHTRKAIASKIIDGSLRAFSRSEKNVLYRIKKNNIFYKNSLSGNHDYEPT